MRTRHDHIRHSKDLSYNWPLFSVYANFKANQQQFESKWTLRPFKAQSPGLGIRKCKILAYKVKRGNFHLVHHSSFNISQSNIHPEETLPLALTYTEVMMRNTFSLPI